MEEMTVLVPVLLKSKLTEALKTRLLAEMNQNLDAIEHDLAQLEFEGNAKLSEQAKINMAGVGQLRAQIEAQKAQILEAKEKIVSDKEQLEKLVNGAELPRGPINRLVTLHIGDDLNDVRGGEILVEDGKIIAFRE